MILLSLFGLSAQVQSPTFSGEGCIFKGMGLENGFVEVNLEIEKATEAARICNLEIPFILESGMTLNLNSIELDSNLGGKKVELVSQVSYPGQRFGVQKFFKSLSSLLVKVGAPQAWSRCGKSFELNLNTKIDGELEENGELKISFRPSLRRC